MGANFGAFMSHPAAALLALGLSLGLALPASAWEGHRSPAGFATAGSAKTGWHGPHRARRHGVPALDRRGPEVSVVVQQIVISPPPPVGFPTVLDLPVELGIREAAPAQPAVYVVNERERHPTQTGSIRLSTGPRIIDVSADKDEPAPAFGAKIIHLTVPVGR
jgi:hypothetical protein